MKDRKKAEVGGDECRALSSKREEFKTKESADGVKFINIIILGRRNIPSSKHSLRHCSSSRNGT